MAKKKAAAATKEPLRLGDYTQVSASEAKAFAAKEKAATLNVETGVGKTFYFTVRPKNQRAVLVALHL